MKMMPIKCEREMCVFCLFVCNVTFSHSISCAILICKFLVFFFFGVVFFVDWFFIFKSILKFIFIFGIANN